MPPEVESRLKALVAGQDVEPGGPLDALFDTEGFTEKATG